ncbi:Chromosomal protein MC1 [uncultured archaeon]|nr:Chromosomal protein MC1 [uncultured archaeon]
MDDKKYFVLQKGGKDTEHIFSGKQPRQAALKAASRLAKVGGGKVDIKLRERGTNKVHVFKGWVDIVKAPANKPDWLPDKVKKANVEKGGIERV